MIYGTGIDLIEIKRIRKLLERNESGFLKRIFTDKEQELIPTGEARRAEYLAGRYAAKEAFSKALGTGIGKGLRWQEIEILALACGKPYINFVGQVPGLSADAEPLVYHLSISHTEDLAIAQVIIEGGNLDGGKPNVSCYC